MICSPYFFVCFRIFMCLSNLRCDKNGWANLLFLFFASFCILNSLNDLSIF